MPTHVETGISKLPSQFANSPILKELLQIYLEEIDELEQCIADIKTQRNVSDAEGVQLDGLGDILGKKREGLADVDYKQVLEVQKILNAGEGQYATALQMWRTLLGSPTATLEEEFPAGVKLFSDVGAPTLQTVQLFTQTLPITVTASITSTYSASPAFCFDGGVGSGFGTTEDSSIGGELISRYTNII